MIEASHRTDQEALHFVDRIIDHPLDRLPSSMQSQVST